MQQIEWRRSKVLELRSEGLNQSEIAEKLKIDKSTLSRDFCRACPNGCFFFPSKPIRNKDIVTDRNYMIISGWGILLIFSSNQGVTQIVIPYHPFGLPTVTILVIASYLMLLGIYNSATLVSTNNELRKSIYKHALESKLLGLIGQAELENEIQNTVKQVSQDKYELEKELEGPVELDETELKNM